MCIRDRHISDLLSLWQGISLESRDGSKHTIRGALLCVACDLPAGWKVCGFLSYNANLGCSHCYCEFGTGVFGHNDLIKALGGFALITIIGRMLRKSGNVLRKLYDKKQSLTMAVETHVFYNFPTLILL